MAAMRLLCVAGLLAVLSAGFVAPMANAQKPKELMWTHAFDLMCRKFGEADFTDKTKKFGVEAFKDFNNELGFFISEVGSVAAVKSPGFAKLTKSIKNSKGPEWVTGLDLASRKADEREFSKDTKRHSLEIFLDVNTDNWIYITEKGFIAATPARGKAVARDKGGKLTHSMNLMARRGGDKEWTNSRKFGVEVYFDGNTNNLIYVCETGYIGVVPEEKKVTGEVKAPELLHGLDLNCRKHQEYLFSKDTQVIGVEAFLDVNNGNLIFITQNGSLAVCPGSKNIQVPSPNPKTPEWKHGLDVKCRKSGEQDFTDSTQKFGVEVFHDDTLGVTLYLGETGALAAVKD